MMVVGVSNANDSRAQDAIEIIETRIPWSDTTKWNAKWWYPMPLGYHERDGFEGYIIDGYGVFMLDPAIPKSSPLFGDMVPINTGITSFGDALEICEARNGEKLINET